MFCGRAEAEGGVKKGIGGTPELTNKDPGVLTAGYLIASGPRLDSLSMLMSDLSLSNFAGLAETGGGIFFVVFCTAADASSFFFYPKIF